MRFDNVVNELFIGAFNDAKDRKHEYVTPEHLLYTMLSFEEGKEIIENCGGNIKGLKSNLEGFFQEYMTVLEKGDPLESIGLHNVVNKTQLQAISSEKKVIRLGDVLISIHDEEESYASYYLKTQGIRRIDLLNYVSHGVSQRIEPDFEDDDFEEFNLMEDEDEFDDVKKSSNMLENFTVELTQKVKDGEVDPLIGREDILKRTIQVLSRRVKNNPIHVGEPGVGKTSITEGLAQLIVEGKAPAHLKDSKIYYLDMGSLLAGTKYRGDFEERIKKVLNDISKQEKAIVYIDEIHTVIGAGAVSGGSMDASNILKPFSTGRNIRFIGSTTYDEYKKYFDKDRALSRRFQKIDITEPSIDETYEILMGLKNKYEEFHNVEYSDEALRLAATLSAKYIQDRFMPDKAIDVIDESAAFVRLNETDDNIKIKVLEKDIERTVSLMAKVPEASVSGNEINKLKSLDIELKKEIFGQDNAIETVVNAIKRSRAGLDEGEKPVASLLFVGPTGVGKTEVAKQLSSTLGIPLIRFDMSEYQEKHTVARLIGAPPGYVGYEEGGLLTDSIRKTPHSVLLLDEIEKAHQDIYNVLLQIMDYATLTDNNGKKADFKNVILLMTSNAGAREVGKILIGFEQRQLNNTEVTKAVDRVFSPEFRNRLDEIVVFNNINEDMALLIAKKAMKKLEGKLAQKKVKLKVDDTCYKWLAEKGFSSVYGAREIHRVVQDNIKKHFVDELLFGKLSQGGKAVISVKDDKIDIQVK